MTRHTALELSIWKELAGNSLSVSHDRWHLDRVLAFAMQLQTLYGGDREVLTAAVIMHDLGRADPDRKHGLASIQASEEGAQAVLAAIDFPDAKRKAVLDAISEHDQPELRPRSIEARILKDADFLAGFGAWGVLRIAMWSGETGRNTSAVLQRLEKGMPRRMAHLEFPESRVIAQREIHVVQVFLEQLRTSPRVTRVRSDSSYIVVEGISGSGKDTQAQMLEARLAAAGRKVVVVHEPTDDFRDYRKTYEAIAGSSLSDPNIRKWLLMASRERLATTTLRPELAAHSVVLSVRNYISTLVYQCASDEEVADTAYAHRDFPQPDLVLLMELPPGDARTRIELRDKAQGDFESLQDLERLADKYRRVCGNYFSSRTQRIDASGTKDEVAGRVWTAVSEYFDYGRLSV